MTEIQKVQMSTEGVEGGKNTLSIYSQREREKKEEQAQFKDIRHTILSDYRPRGHPKFETLIFFLCIFFLINDH